MVEFLSETNLGSVYFRKFKGQALFQETGEKKKKKTSFRTATGIASYEIKFL